MTRTLSKHWIQTYTGREFDVANPRAEDVCLEDIAHALSNLCRFTGHTKRFYSVAQHSVIVSHVCNPADALWGLLHDATEAYLLDIAKPVKSLLLGYEELEASVAAVVCEAMGLALPMPASVKRADMVLLATEARDLLLPHPWAWELGVEPLPDPIDPWPPHVAKVQFLRRFGELTSPDGVTWAVLQEGSIRWHAVHQSQGEALCGAGDGRALYLLARAPSFPADGYQCGACLAVLAQRRILVADGATEVEV